MPKSAFALSAIRLINPMTVTIDENQYQDKVGILEKRMKGGKVTDLF